MKVHPIVNTFQDVKAALFDALIQTRKPGEFTCLVGLIGNAMAWIDDGHILSIELGDSIDDVTQWDASAMDQIGPDVVAWLANPAISDKVVLVHQTLDSAGEDIRDLLDHHTAVRGGAPATLGNYYILDYTSMEPSPLTRADFNELLTRATTKPLTGNIKPPDGIAPNHPSRPRR